jgi:hypothetical protein
VEWHACRASDLAELGIFLRANERFGLSLVARIAREGRLRPSIKGELALGREGGRLRAAILADPGGGLYPLFSPDASYAGAASLIPLIGRALARPRAILGCEEAVSFVQGLVGRRPAVSIPYGLLALRGPPSIADLTPPLPALAARRASPDDLAALFPLQAAYEREEVALDQEGFDDARCRRHLAGLLRDQELWLCEGGGRALAKAGTNARGFEWDQIGGVYCAPEWRGKSLARFLCARFFDSLSKRGRRVALFVKRTNGPARALYERLGFEEISAFTIAYF